MKILSCASRGRGKAEHGYEQNSQHLEIGTDISNAITSVQKDYMVIEIEDETDRCEGGRT